MEEDRLAIIIGKNITRLRRVANMTQFELAEKLHYSDKSVSKWEQGNGIPDVHVLVRIAEIFGVTCDDLVHEHVNEKEVVPKHAKLRNRIITIACSVGLCWLVAVVTYVLWGLFGSGEETKWAWLAFVFAVPASSVVVLVFSCVWRWKWVRVISISVLIWTAIGFVYLVAYAALRDVGNLWLLFLIGIPLQILTLFYFVWRRGARTKENKE